MLSFALIDMGKNVIFVSFHADVCSSDVMKLQTILIGHLNVPNHHIPELGSSFSLVNAREYKPSSLVRQSSLISLFCAGQTSISIRYFYVGEIFTKFYQEKVRG